MNDSIATLVERKQYSRSWRKSRLAARLLRRQDAGRIVSRDVVLGKKLATDPAVTPRLIQQALDSFTGRQRELVRARRR